MTGVPEKIDWRVYFQNRSFHAIICGSVIELLKRVIATAKYGELITEENYRTYYRRLNLSKTEDLSQVYKLFFLNCDTTKATRTQFTSKLISLLRALDDNQNDFSREHFDKIRFLSWRLREAETLCKFLKEARNAQAHDNHARQQLGWLISIPSTILRLLEICPTNQDLKEQVKELETTCRRHLDLALSTGSDIPSSQPKDAQNTANEETKNYQNDDKLEAIGSKLDKVLSLLAKNKNIEAPRLQQLQSNFSEMVLENTLENEEELQENEAYPDIEYLTPNMVRDELNKLGLAYQNSQKEDILGSPNERFLQIAIIDEILNSQPNDVQDIVSLPDVKWRVKRYPKAMKNQIEKLKGPIQDILNRAVWE